MEAKSTGNSRNVTPLRQTGETPPRVPPHNYEAEMALLGAILANNLVFDKVNEFLRPDHFADALHGRIYEAAGKLIERGQIANVLTLKNLFDQDPALAEHGGGQYLARLAASVVTIINAEDYGRTIYDLDILDGAEKKEIAKAQLSGWETVPQMEAKLALPDGGDKLVIVAGHLTEKRGCWRSAAPAAAAPAGKGGSTFCQASPG